MKNEECRHNNSKKGREGEKSGIKNVKERKNKIEKIIKHMICKEY